MIFKALKITTVKCGIDLEWCKAQDAAQYKSKQVFILGSMDPNTPTMLAPRAKQLAMGSLFASELTFQQISSL